MLLMVVVMVIQVCMIDGWTGRGGHG